MFDPDLQRLIPGIVLGALLCTPALRLLRRSSEERLVGLFFLASGIGFGARVAAVRPDESVDMVLNGVGHVALSLACIALYRFTRVVFRTESQAGRTAEAIGIAASLATLVAVFVGDGLVDERSVSVLAANLVRLTSYAWSFGEALRYWRMMRKRVTLGLADPTVSNRFGLWSIWTGGLASMLAVVLILRMLAMVLGPNPAHMPFILPLLQPLLAAVALVSGAAVWLTFFPPRFYTRRLVGTG